MGRVIRILLLIAAAPLLVVLALLLLPFIVGIMIVEHWRLRRFLKANEGCVFLVCTRRHGWHEMLVNNLIPALRDSVVVCWMGSGAMDRQGTLFPAKMRQRLRGVRKPFAIRIRHRKMEVIPLHRPLLHVKGLRKKSAEAGEILRLAFQGMMQAVDDPTMMDAPGE